ncbi:MAG: hypothetical protein ACI8RD_014696 [Bacillariaceae sp.]|jgi:hypothetical protein
MVSHTLKSFTLSIYLSLSLYYYNCTLGLSKKRSAEAKAKGLRAEINNGRLAQLGIFGFLCEQTIPGSVPLLSGIVQPYSGEVMAPFSDNMLRFGL